MNVKRQIIIFLIFIVIAMSAMAFRPVYHVDNIYIKSENRTGSSRQSKVFVTGKLTWRFANGR